MNDYLTKIAKRILLVGLIIFLFFVVKDLNAIGFSKGKFLVYLVAISLVLVLLNAQFLSKAKDVYVDQVLSNKGLSYVLAGVLGLLNGLFSILLSIFFGTAEVVFFTDVLLVDMFSLNKLSVVFKTSLFLALVSYVWYVVYFSNLKQTKLLVQQKVLTSNVSAQFESLKNQLDPHFLFNSLNVLSSLIEENPEKAQEFTHSLSTIYRYILHQKNQEHVLLTEELEFAHHYMDLLQMRFEQGLSYSIAEHSYHSEARVVPLALQLLLENVIKHNKISSLKPVHIQIDIQEDYLVIQNNLNLKDQTDARVGIGLENIVNRYGLLTERKVIQEQTLDYFTIKIPILTRKIKTMEIIEDKDENLLIKAQEKVEKLKGFYSHLTTFIAVNLFLMVINLMVAPSFLWFLIILFGWGIFIIIHAMKVYNYNLFLGKDWEDRKIKYYMEDEKTKVDKWK